MLITTCTHCLARFRVSPQQLNAKQGQVRCGRCRKVFSGFEALERYPDDDTGSRLLAQREAELKATAPAEPDELLPVEAPAEPPAPPPPPPTPTPTPVAPPPVEAGPISKPLEAKPPDTKPIEPKLHRTGPIIYEVERAPSHKNSAAWRYGVALLLVILSVEILYATRGDLAQRYPVLRPWLESACTPFHCTVPWPNNEALLKLEDSELLEVPGKANQIALGARIRNLAPNAQEYPYLELTLTDVTGQAAARRVLRPTDYLGRPVAAGEVLAAGADLALQIRLETRNLKATGYELLLFYP
jgi:predicted Zn finger-like uncharacterized protein